MAQTLYNISHCSDTEMKFTAVHAVTTVLSQWQCIGYSSQPDLLKRFLHHAGVEAEHWGAEAAV